MVDDIYAINFVNINDILIDRIKGLTHWDAQNYGDQIIDLISYNEENIDIQYIESKLNSLELAIWHNVKNIFQEDESLENIIYRLKSRLEEEDIIYSETIIEELEKYYIFFPIVYKQKGVHLGIDIIENCQEVVYDRDEDEIIDKEWPEHLTNVWNQYHDVLRILSEVNE